MSGPIQDDPSWKPPPDDFGGPKPTIEVPEWVEKGLGIVTFIALCAFVAMAVALVFFCLVRVGMWLVGA